MLFIIKLFLSALSFLVVSSSASKTLLIKCKSTKSLKIGLYKMVNICSTKFNGLSFGNFSLLLLYVLFTN